MSEDTVQRLMGLAEAFGRTQRRWAFDAASPDEIQAARSTLESALREALQPAGWRPISSAAAGRDVLLWGAKGEPGPFIGDWKNYFRFNNPKITHWMPLPAAPSATTAPEAMEANALGVSPSGPRSPSQAPPIADAAGDVLSVNPSASDANGR